MVSISALKTRSVLFSSETNSHFLNYNLFYYPNIGEFLPCPDKDFVKIDLHEIF
jgi:hypothetical protein